MGNKINKPNGVSTHNYGLKAVLRSAAQLSIVAVLSLPATSLAQFTVAGFASQQAGTWSPDGAVVGTLEPNGSCSNVGNGGQSNLVWDFGFSIPVDATGITGVIHTKTGSANAQPGGISIQAYEDASTPATPVGTNNPLDILDVGPGNCADTTFTGHSQALTGTYTPAKVNATTFGLDYTSTTTPQIKIDAVCIEISYTSATPPAPGILISCEGDVVPAATTTTTSTTTTTTTTAAPTTTTTTTTTAAPTTTTTTAAPTTTTTTAAPTTTTTTTTLPPSLPEVSVNTMNRYGLTLLALLMLGIGFIGFRRLS